MIIDLAIEQQTGSRWQTLQVASAQVCNGFVILISIRHWSATVNVRIGMVSQTVRNTSNPGGNRCSANCAGQTRKDYSCGCSAQCTSLQKPLRPGPGPQYNTVHGNKGDRLGQPLAGHLSQPPVQLSPSEAGSGAATSGCSEAT